MWAGWSWLPLLSDFLLGIFAILGLEHATVPDDYASKHYLLFTFPYSHGFLALLVWATIFGYLISRAFGVDTRRVRLVASLVVLSHFLLDGLVHIAGLPVAGENSPKLGLGLWNHMPLELLLESLMAIAGMAIYWRLARANRSALSRYGMTVFVALIAGMTWTQLLLTTPPKTEQLSVSWIAVPLVFSAVAYALDRRRVRDLSGSAGVP